jgi:hypothetical protein
MEAVKWANGGGEISEVGDEARRQESFAACHWLWTVRIQRYGSDAPSDMSNYHHWYIQGLCC